jgi:hypothetical protein
LRLGVGSQICVIPWRGRRPAVERVERLLSSRPKLFFILASDGGALLGRWWVCGVEPPIALFDAASPLMPGNGGADMVWASTFADSGDFPLRLAGRQGEDLIAEAR